MIQLKLKVLFGLIEKWLLKSLEFELLQNYFCIFLKAKEIKRNNFCSTIFKVIRQSVYVCIYVHKLMYKCMVKIVWDYLSLKWKR